MQAAELVPSAAVDAQESEGICRCIERHDGKVRSFVKRWVRKNRLFAWILEELVDGSLWWWGICGASWCGWSYGCFPRVKPS